MGTENEGMLWINVLTILEQVLGDVQGIKGQSERSYL